MSFPTFIGIGTPRAGTSWLNDLLNSHPEVYMPVRRKEVNYFNLNYEKGLEWYGKFFPDDKAAFQYKAIGEISPHYLYCEECPERIKSIGSVRNLVLQIRNPCDRAFSYYQLRIKNTNFSGTFQEFIRFRPETLDEGHYSRYLKNFLDYYPREKILILIFEKMFLNLTETKILLANYLGIDAGKFPIDSGIEKVNKSFVPKSRKAYSITHQFARFLRDNDLDTLVNWSKKIGFANVLGEGSNLPKMDSGTRDYLQEIYRNEKKELESLLEIDLSCWEMSR